MAAANGHLHILNWARANGYPPWDESICSHAAENGHLHVLKWARENNCPWKEHACAYAAMGGKLEVLKWMREMGVHGIVRHMRLLPDMALNGFTKLDAHGMNGRVNMLQNMETWKF
jgi:hypothetical protein